MTSIEIADKIKEILDNKKAVDINILKVKEKTVLADYFVVATGTSSVHVKSLAEEVEVKMEELFGISPKGCEGRISNSWVLLDYGDVIVYIFSAESRDFYKLDNLWSDKK